MAIALATLFGSDRRRARGAHRGHLHDHDHARDRARRSTISPTRITRSSTATPASTPISTPHFWGVDWRAAVPFYYLTLVVAALCYCGGRLSLARAVRACAARRARQSAPHGRARLQRQRASRRRLRLRRVPRRARRHLAGLELQADLAGLGQRVDAAIDILIIAVVGGITRPIGPFIGALDLRAAAHLRARFPASRSGSTAIASGC